MRIQNAEQLKSFVSLAKSLENQIPCVVFTQLKEEREMPRIEDMVPQLGTLNPLMKLDVPIKAAPSAAVDPPYDIPKFSRSGVTYCRTYILEDSLREKIAGLFHRPIKPGDILTIEPASQGGKLEIYPFKSGKAGQEQTIAQLQAKFYTYCRDRQYAFGNIVFLTSARNELIRSTEDAARKAEKLSESFAQEMEEIKTKWRSEVTDKDREIENLQDKISRLKEHQARLEEEKDVLREIAEKAREDSAETVQSKDMEIRYLRRKLNQPKLHSMVAEWVSSCFADRLELHPKAVKLLEERSAQNTDVALICDALDYLATDYWDCRYQVINQDTMRSRCSQKYGRPFEITPVGDMTIEQLPGEYKIKCALGSSGKRTEHGLDYHLKVGNDPENLLRIYFLHDDEKKKIIVGSLPCHLTAVKIK